MVCGNATEKLGSFTAPSVASLSQDVGESRVVSGTAFETMAACCQQAVAGCKCFLMGLWRKCCPLKQPEPARDMPEPAQDMPEPAQDVQSKDGRAERVAEVQAAYFGVAGNR